MTPVQQPESNHVYSTDLPVVPTRLLVHTLGLAAYLGTVGLEVESLSSRRGGVIRRVPIAAKPAARKYESSFRALTIARERFRRAIGSQRATGHEHA